jgi:hypothetical protein
LCIIVGRIGGIIVGIIGMFCWVMGQIVGRGGCYGIGLVRLSMECCTVALLLVVLVLMVALIIVLLLLNITSCTIITGIENGIG